MARAMSDSFVFLLIEEEITNPSIIRYLVSLPPLTQIKEPYLLYQLIKQRLFTFHQAGQLVRGLSDYWD